jgi:hypothetical protein
MEKHFMTMPDGLNSSCVEVFFLSVVSDRPGGLDEGVWPTQVSVRKGAASGVNLT